MFPPANLGSAGRIPSTSLCLSVHLRMGPWLHWFRSLQFMHEATFVSVSTGAFQLRRSHSSLGSQHAHLLQNRPIVLESTRYHQPSSSGTLRSCRSRSSSTSAPSSTSRTSHIRSHCLVHSPLHVATCCAPTCLITRHRHHEEVDLRHPKYTVSGAPISTGGPFHSSFSHSHGNRSMHLSLTRHTTSVSSPFLHFTSGPVHFRLSATPCHPFMCALNCIRSCVAWLMGSGCGRTSTTFSMRLAPSLCRLQLRASSRIRLSGTVLVA